MSELLVQVILGAIAALRQFYGGSIPDEQQRKINHAMAQKDADDAIAIGEAALKEGEQ